MVSYLSIIVTMCLGSTIDELEHVENLVTLTFQGHARSKFIVGKENLHMVSYLSIIVTQGLGSTIWELEHFENLMDLDLTFQGHAGSKFIVGKESLHMVSYLSIIVTQGLGSTIWELRSCQKYVCEGHRVKVKGQIQGHTPKGACT